MSRRAGVKPSETREELLSAALRLLLEQGFAGVRTTEIAKAAGVSTGAIYSQFGSKAELLLAAITESTPRLVAEHLASGRQSRILDLLGDLGTVLPERAERMGPLLLEIIVSSQRDPEIGEVVSQEWTKAENATAEALRLGQADGEVVAALDDRAMSRFISMLVFGSMVAATLKLPDVEPAAWNAVVAHLLDAVRAAT